MPEDFRHQWTRRPQLRVDEKQVDPNRWAVPPGQDIPVPSIDRSLTTMPADEQPAQTQPPQQDPATLSGTVRQPTFDEQYQTAQQDYNEELTNGRKKPHPALEALYVGLQGLSRVFQPSNEPIRTLRDTREQQRLARKGQVLGGLQQQQQYDQKIRHGNAQIETEREQQRNYQNQVINRNAQTVLDMDKAVQDRLTSQQANILKVWSDLDTYDESLPEYTKLKERAEKAGVQLVKKDKGQRYSTQIAPDGRIVVTNTSTGTYNIGQENLSKPKTVTAKDVFDLFSDLPDDAKLDTIATAQVGQLPTSRRVRPEVLANLPAEYKNPDGSLNEAYYWKKVGEGAYSKPVYTDGTVGEEKGTNISPTELYENLPSDYAQKKAQARLAAGKPYEAKRSEVTKLAAAVESQRPLQSGGQTKSRREVKDMFDTIYQVKDAKKRRQQLDDLYKTIEAGYLQVQ